MLFSLLHVSTQSDLSIKKRALHSLPNDKIILWVLITILSVAFSSPVLAGPLRLGTSVWPGYEPLFLARQLKQLDSSKVRLIEYRSASQVINAMKMGVVDAATLTLDEALTLNAEGVPVTIVLVTDISTGADVILSQPDITQASQLKGKKVGAEGTAVGAFILSRFLQQNNLSRQDILFIPLQIHQHEKAFKDGLIEAVATFEPVRSKLISEGAVILFSSNEMPGEIVDVIAIRSSELETKLNSVAELRTAWSKALAYISTQPFEAYQLLGERLKLDEVQTKEAYSRLKLVDMQHNNRLLKKGGGIEESIVKIRLLLNEFGLLPRQINTDLPAILHEW